MKRAAGALHWKRGAGIMLVLAVLGSLTSAAFALSGRADETTFGVALSPGAQRRGLPQEPVIFTHTLANTGTLTDTYVLSLTATAGWDASMTIEGQGSTLLAPVTLGPMMTQALQTSLTAPFAAYSGTVGHLALHATSVTTPSVRAVVTDTVTVYRTPNVALSPAQARTALPGEVVTFTHCLTNTGPLTDTFAVRATIAPTWPLTLRMIGADPQTSHLPMPPLGELESACFAARVEAPRDITTDTRAALTLHAASLTMESVQATITDTLWVGKPHQIFLPLVEKYAPPAVKLGVDFGIIITRTDVITQDFPIVKEMGADWSRVFLGWHKIERERGEYDWADYDAVFEGLAANDIKAIVVVYGAPQWAAVEEMCGPISDTEAFSMFVEALVPRYADVTEAWEFINEPDGSKPHEYGPAIGCWATEPLSYVVQLGEFYHQVKALDPTADVFHGGLAYDNWDHFDREFFTNTLSHGAGRYFDGLSLHYYPINPWDFPTLGAKVSEIVDIMRAHGVSRKKIWVTETSMWVHPLGPFDGSVELQRDFIVEQLTYGYAAGADNIFWFQVREEGWDEGARRWLIDIHHQPVNGYTTFVNYAEKMKGRRYQGRYAAAPETVEAFTFSDTTSKLYVMWSTSVTETVRIPATAPALLTGRDGEMTRTLPVADGVVTAPVGPRAVFVEIEKP